MYDLKGKRALVCGSTQGIGRACAMELAAAGASVTLAARNAKSLAKSRDGLAMTAGQAHGVIFQDFNAPPRACG